MTQINLKQILNQLETLNPEELKQLNQMVQQSLTEREELNPQDSFHQSLLTMGLVKQIKHPVYEPISERNLIEIKGQPMSETIIEERR